MSKRVIRVRVGKLEAELKAELRIMKERQEQVRQTILFLIFEEKTIKRKRTETREIFERIWLQTVEAEKKFEIQKAEKECQERVQEIELNLRRAESQLTKIER